MTLKETLGAFTQRFIKPDGAQSIGTSQAARNALIETFAELSVAISRQGLEVIRRSD